MVEITPKPIFTKRNQPNVGKYNSHMDPMGMSYFPTNSIIYC